jgi:DNA-binding transcriptional LysR family regulator
MDTKWVEDFLCLTETRSFKRAALARNASQAAFSRRIQSLELWVGADLVDRSCTPLSLTPAGHTFRCVAENIVRQVNLARKLVQTHDTTMQEIA